MKKIWQDKHKKEMQNVNKWTEDKIYNRDETVSVKGKKRKKEWKKNDGGTMIKKGNYGKLWETRSKRVYVAWLGTDDVSVERRKNLYMWNQKNTKKRNKKAYKQEKKYKNKYK